MKKTVQKILFTVLCFISVQSIAQTSSLTLDIQLDNEYDDHRIYVVKGIDTVAHYVMDDYYMIYQIEGADTIHQYEMPLIIDSLEAGDYRIYIYDNLDSDDYTIRKSVRLEDDKRTSVGITLFYTENMDDADEEDYKSKAELQFSLGYFNGNWIDPKTALINNFSASYDAYYWGAFSKHAGFLLGSGFNVSQHYFQKDTTYFENIAFKKIFERYTLIGMNYEAKIRLSTGDQQSRDISGSKIFIDLGARYCLPILFNHAAMYRGSKKLIERNIHNFKDFRAFVNIGYAPFSFFMEYRLVDFVRADNPQLPRFNAGFKFMLPE